MGILPKESRVVSDEEDYNDETTAEGEERYYEGVCMDEEDSSLDDLRYNVECKKHFCINRKHAEDSLKREIETLARSEAKAAMKLRSRQHMPSLST